MERAQARHARRLAPVRHGRVEAGEDRRAQRPDDLLLDDPAAEELIFRVLRKSPTERQKSSRRSTPKWLAPCSSTVLVRPPQARASALPFSAGVTSSFSASTNSAGTSTPGARAAL